MIGERIGNFKIVQQLGQGGMGAVFLGEHDKVGTKVAIKMLLPHISENKEVVERFFNEAVAAGKIQHVGVAKVFDVGFLPDGRAYLIMEYLPGETLGDRLGRLGRLSVPQVAEINKQICAILDAVHQAGITHRDLKPENVFLVPDHEIGERVRLVDFGIAKLSTITGNLTSSAHAMGTPAYMSPEQWLSSKSVDWRSDAYALGCMTYEMITGRPPFSFETIGEACSKHLNERPAPLATVPPLEHLVMALLAKQPDQRPASMRDIGQQFALLAAPSSPHIPSPHIPAPHRAPAPLPSGPIEAATVRAIPMRPSDLETVQAPHRPLLPPTLHQPEPPRRPTPRMIEVPQTAFTPPVQQTSFTPPVHQAVLTPTPRPVASTGRWKLGLAAVVIAGGATGAVVLAKRSDRKSTDTSESSSSDAALDPGDTTAKLTAPGSGLTGSAVTPGSAVDPSLPVEVDGTMVSEAFRSVKQEVPHCGAKSTEKGVVKIAVTVNADGSLASAVVKDSFDAAVGQCVAGEVMRAHFPKTQRGGTFVYPFLF